MNSLSKIIFEIFECMFPNETGKKSLIKIADIYEFKVNNGNTANKNSGNIQSSEACLQTS